MHSSALPQEPSTSSEESVEYVIVNFPGVIKNIQKAIDSLGGEKIINATHAAHRPLELRYRPENAYANPLISERQTIDRSSGTGTVYAVLKVRRKKSNPLTVDAKITGIVSTLYSFKTMCDFQYLPLQKKEIQDNHYEDLALRLIPHDLPSALSWWETSKGGEEIPLFLPPYQFSRYNTPSNKILCRETDFSLEKIKQKNAGHGQSLRCERKALSITVHANDVFPEAPSKEAVTDANLRCKHEEPHKLLENLFKERPMWTRVGIASKTGLEEFLIKTLIQKFAFYILSGPWGRLWCRFGYDPRTDPSAKIYQTVMVTFRQHTKIPERQRLKVVKLTSERALPVSVSCTIPSTLNSSTCQLEDHPIDYWYSPGQLPRVRQMWYCLCDVRLPVAEKILRKTYFAQGDRADEQYGWLPPEAVEQVREAIKEDVKKVSDQLDEDGETDGLTNALDEDWNSN